MAPGSMNAAQSRSEQVFEALRFELLESNIRPGDRLKFIELAERFGVSQTVVREALTRLSEQGLVVSSPNKGFMVMPLSVDDLLDLTNVRVQLETTALIDSIENGDLLWETVVVAAHHALERTPFVTEAPQAAATWRQCHRAFHKALCSGCRSPRLERVVCQLRDSAELYRIWSRSLGTGATRDVLGEHRALMGAALDRDVLRASQLLADHISLTTETLLSEARKTAQSR